ncbi:MAG TPA: beta-ketoacyl synthase N-terminal-like domain-containing protein [Candidatus Binatia bacterium]|nr:beta-ketoacyl synthase N-terminal-like domain-containing protein [Candidatus Binatia bacterium]
MTGDACLLGCGLVTSLGDGLAAQLPALRAGRAGAHAVPQGYQMPPWPYHLAVAYAGATRMYDMLDRAVEQALAEADLAAAQLDRMAVLVGSTCLDLPLQESEYAAQAAAGAGRVPIKGPNYGNVAAHLAQRFGLRGPQYTLNTACSSSANALLHARLLLHEGRVQHALVVGVESYNRLSVQGFGSLMLLSKSRYRPFDRDRDGLILGEGAGALVLGTGGGTERIVGAASACDPSSPTNSAPARIAEVMQAALADGGVPLGALAAIKAHGTGTGSNDGAEGQAMRELGAAAGGLPPFTSLKPYVGHTLGGCGAIELLLLLAAWREGFLPATPEFAQADPAIGVAPLPAAVALPARGAVLCNFFGFGGNNTSLVVARG